MTKEAWIVVDLVNDFVSGKFKSEGSDRVVGATAQILPKLKEDVLLVFTLDSHVPSDPEFKIWGEHCLTGTWGSELDDRLKPYYTYGIRKRRYDAFLETDLDAYLRMHDVKRVYLSGVATDVCVLHTAAGAFFRYYEISVIEDLCNGITQSGHNSAIEQMKRLYGADVISASEFRTKVCVDEV